VKKEGTVFRVSLFIPCHYEAISIHTASNRILVYKPRPVSLLMIEVIAYFPRALASRARGRSLAVASAPVGSYKNPARIGSHFCNGLPCQSCVSLRTYRRSSPSCPTLQMRNSE